MRYRLNPWEERHNEALLAASPPIETLIRDVSRTALTLYAGLMVYGCLLLFLGSLMIVVDASSSTRVSTARMWSMIALAGLALAVVVGVVRNVDRNGPTAWAALLAALVAMAGVQRLAPGNDAMLRSIVSAIIVVGGAMLGVARLWLVPRIERFLSMNPLMQVTLAVVVWASVPAALVAVSI